MSRKNTLPKNKLLGVKIEECTLINPASKIIYLIPYKNDYAGLDSLLVDVAENEKELREIVKEHQQYGDDIRIIRIKRGGK